MPDTISRLCLIAIVAALLLAPATTGAQDFTIFSDFNADTPGLPPATGGPNQPTAVINIGVTVETSANGIADDGTVGRRRAPGRQPAPDRQARHACHATREESSSPVPTAM